MILTDTGFWLAFFNSRDKFHQQSVAVIFAEELGHGRILSTDQRDFGAYRWKNHLPFENLLLRL